MRKPFVFPILAILLIMLATSCKHSADLPTIRTSLVTDRDGVIRDMTEERKSNYWNAMQVKLDSSLGIETIQNGYKGLQMRVWSGVGLTYRGRLFLLKHDGSSWKGEMYYYRDTFSHLGEGETARYEGATDIERIELKQSNSEWEDLVKDLFALGIDTLPDYTRLNSYGINADENGVMVELGQEGFYKTYQYLTPSLRQKEFDEAKQVVQMLKLIDRKFGNKLKEPALGG